ncbi:MAG TPA: LysR family transcriptional regulator [Candidatus Polarisedimenticolaceae bacterium]|nr:LysR family transcriptional regulator [Candidatus Polarisedimenticolaceae bacterium]
MTDVPALEAFVSVARLGSVVRAAERLGRTQPSISARLAALESAWNTRLFRRHARGMALTPEGERLLPAASAALDRLQALDREAGVSAGVADELRIGSGDALGREVIPRAIARLLRESGDLSIRVLEGSAGKLIESVRAGEIDFALVTGPAPAEGRGSLLFEPVLSSRVELLVPRGERAAGPATLASLGRRRIVALQRGSGFRRHVENAFEEASVPFAPAVEVGNLSLVRRFVAAGLGVAPVPAIAFAGARGGLGVRRRSLGGIPPVPYTLVRRAGIPLTASARRLLDRLRPRAAAR